MMRRRIWLLPVRLTEYPLQSCNVHIERIGISPLLEENNMARMIALPVDRVVDTAFVLSACAGHRLLNDLRALGLAFRF
jgi:hypothetical protein